MEGAPQHHRHSLQRWLRLRGGGVPFSEVSQQRGRGRESRSPLPPHVDQAPHSLGKRLSHVMLHSRGTSPGAPLTALRAKDLGLETASISRECEILKGFSEIWTWLLQLTELESVCRRLPKRSGKVRIQDVARRESQPLLFHRARLSFGAIPFLLISGGLQEKATAQRWNGPLGWVNQSHRPCSRPPGQRGLGGGPGETVATACLGGTAADRGLWDALGLLGWCITHTVVLVPPQEMWVPKCPPLFSGLHLLGGGGALMPPVQVPCAPCVPSAPFNGLPVSKVRNPLPGCRA